MILKKSIFTLIVLIMWTQNVLSSAECKQTPEEQDLELAQKLQAEEDNAVRDDWNIIDPSTPMGRQQMQHEQMAKERAQQIRQQLFAKKNGSSSSSSSSSTKPKYASASARPSTPFQAPQNNQPSHDKEDEILKRVLALSLAEHQKNK